MDDKRNNETFSVYKYLMIPINIQKQPKEKTQKILFVNLLFFILNNTFIRND